MKHLNYLALAAIAVFLTTTTAQAALIVDWGGDYVASTQNGPGPSGDSGGHLWNSTNNTVHQSRGGHVFSLNTARSPGSSYSGTSDAFYGGLAVMKAGGGSGGTARMRYQVVDNGASDLLRMAVVVNEGNTDSKLAGLAAWKQNGFLGGADSATVSFAANPGEFGINSISVTVDDINNAGSGAGSDSPDNVDRLRWWVESGGTRYISQDVTGASTVGTGTWTTNDFSTLMWTQSLVTEGSFDRMYISGGSFTTSSSSLTDVSAIGFYVQSQPSRWRSASLNAVDFSSFEVDAELVEQLQPAIPEPATAGLAILGLAGLGGLRRRRVG